MGFGGASLRFLAAASIVAATGCAHPPPKIFPKASPPPHGQVEFQFIADPKMAPPRVTDHQELVAPSPIGRLVAPTYPPAPLAAHAGPASVALRIVIGAEGHVVEVRDSPLMGSTPSPFAADFRAAAETAVRRWRFSPGRIDQYEDGADLDGDGVPDSTRLAQSDVIRVFYDVRFDFEIVGGEGRVRSSAPGGSP